MVIVGDDRQLSAVGPGGALASIVAHHPEAVHELTENVRQRDPGEAIALEHLRAGDVEVALAWYARAGRLEVAPDRETLLERAVAGWAADVAHGLDARLYAWRRADVAALNARAREALWGPAESPWVPGEWIVALARDADNNVVTSQHGRVVDVDEATVTVEWDGGRRVAHRAEDLTPDRYGYGYAVTAHRAQGETCDRSHYLSAGAGRELSATWP